MSKIQSPSNNLNQTNKNIEVQMKKPLSNYQNTTGLSQTQKLNNNKSDEK